MMQDLAGRSMSKFIIVDMSLRGNRRGSILRVQLVLSCALIVS